MSTTSTRPAKHSASRSSAIERRILAVQRAQSHYRQPPGPPRRSAGWPTAGRDPPRWCETTVPRTTICRCHRRRSPGAPPCMPRRYPVVAARLFPTVAVPVPQAFDPTRRARSAGLCNRTCGRSGPPRSPSRQPWVPEQGSRAPGGAAASGRTARCPTRAAVSGSRSWSAHQRRNIP